MHNFSTYSLITNRGERKYLNAVERGKFYNATLRMPLERRLFSQLLYHTGARISEVSELRCAQIDFADKSVIIRTLKQRKADVYRQIPLPDGLLDDLLIHMNKRVRDCPKCKLGQGRIWTFSTRTASRFIKAIMTDAGLSGVKSSAKGLRHGFAVQVSNIVALTQVQLWLGHSDLKTTSIYLNICGHEERALMEKVWKADK